MSGYSKISVRQAVKEEFQPIKDHLKQLGKIDIFPGYSADLLLCTTEDVTDPAFNDDQVFNLNFILKLYKGQIFMGAGDYTFYMDLEFIDNSVTIKHIMDEVLTDAFLYDGCKSYLLFGLNKFTVQTFTVHQVKNYSEYMTALVTKDPLFVKRKPSYYASLDLVKEVEEKGWHASDIVYALCEGLKHYSADRRVTRAFYQLVELIVKLDPVCKVDMNSGFILHTNHSYYLEERIYAFEGYPGGTYLLVDAPHKLFDQYELAQTLTNQ